MDPTDISSWLTETDEQKLAGLWSLADRIRAGHVGTAVHLRGLIEISNYCVRHCAYCGLHTGNTSLKRYRMTETEIIACAETAVRFGYGTVVLQSGEDRGISAEWLAGVIQKIKHSTTLAVTLSLGERHPDELKLWRRAGADRYLLRFETSDRELYKKIHPPTGSTRRHRIEQLAAIRELGYETGSGIMVGIPGQTFASLTRDLLLFRDLDLDMVGIGPWLPHPDTVLGAESLPADNHVPNTDLMSCKVLALARILCPDANIPATTALATLNPETGRSHGLERGANVLMPNLTPDRYKKLYEIYPNKSGSTLSAEQCDHIAKKTIRALGRKIGTGQGSRIKTTPAIGSTVTAS